MGVGIDKVKATLPGGPDLAGDEKLSLQQHWMLLLGQSELLLDDLRGLRDDWQGLHDEWSMLLNEYWLLDGEHRHD